MSTSDKVALTFYELFFCFFNLFTFMCNLLKPSFQESKLPWKIEDEVG